MRVVIAPDKFKGSLSAKEAAEAIALGVRSADADAELDLVPMADGGEGTVEALVAATSGSFRFAEVTGPRGETVRARFGILGDREFAVVEMAEASGLWLVPQELRDPSITTTRGTGQLLLAAIDAGVRRVILGIGGSATNDGGAGLAQALGYRLIDDRGADIPAGGGGLERLDRIDAAGRDPRLDGVEILVACDVDNPLCGERGASAVFGPQKGASAGMVAVLDKNLAHFAAIIERDLCVSIRELPGAGAAGGLGGGLVAFAGGTLTRGFDLIQDSVRLGERLRSADLCFTGEGKLDVSSAGGKTAVGVARLARSLGVAVFALVGDLELERDAARSLGFDACFSLCPRPMKQTEALAQAAIHLTRVAAEATSAFHAGLEKPRA